MNDLRKRSLAFDNVKTIIGRYNFSEARIKRTVPRVNFKKVKLFKLFSLVDSLQKRNINKVYLDENLIKLDFPTFREVKEQKEEGLTFKPLRKKKDIDELPKKQEIKQKTEEQVKEKLFESKKTEQEEIQGPVFQMPYDLKGQEEKEKGLESSSQSIEALNLIWPPQTKEEKTESKDISLETKGQVESQKKKTSKEKPYFIKEESFKEEKRQTASPFPWITEKEQYEGLESIFIGGLESELIDMPLQKQTEELLTESKIEDLSLTHTLFRAFKPHSTSFVEIHESGENKISLGRDLLGKAENMFDKLKNTPLRIVIWGGLTITLGYLLISRYLGDSFNYFGQVQDKDILIRDFTNRKLITKRDISEKGVGKEISQEDSGFELSPISEEQRLSLIQKAREALQGTIDPFGGESFIPPPVAEKIGKLGESSAPEEIEVQRKQLELVGVISAQNKNLALVNVYTADYSVLLTDDFEIRKDKLKQALSKAVPNRYEVSILDPVEDWYVKLISKGKSRAEDPVIELVKGDKKFKIKVGQKVLLPEENPLPEPILEDSEG